MVVVSHAWGYSIHWLVAAVGGVVGPAVGLSLKILSRSVGG
jgi:uncharacterized membrane protein YdfJ with MMPL/SSD domain